MLLIDDALVEEILRRTHDNEAVIRSAEDERHARHCWEKGLLDCWDIRRSGGGASGLKVKCLTEQGKVEHQRRFDGG